MEQTRLFKVAEQQLTAYADRLTALRARAEDLVFRAHRMAAAEKSKKAATKDLSFNEDLHLFRRAVRAYDQESSTAASVISTLERECHYDPEMLGPARAVYTVALRLAKDAASIRDQALMLHHQIPDKDLKIEAWLTAQQLEGVAQRFQAYPFAITSRVYLRLSTPASDAPVEDKKP